jgi:hypothetical protein
MAEADGARRRQPNLSYSYDMLGEGARTDADALQHLASYQNAIQKIASSDHPTLGIEQKDGISIKLSALHPRYEAAQHARVMRELVPRVWSLCERAARANVGLTIDAEEVDRLELSLDVFEALVAQVAQHFPQWRGFGLALQAYQTRALPLIEHIIGLARRYRLRFMCRLVKGAYWDAEIKRAQELGLPHYPVFTHKHHTDVSYLACARALLAAPDAIYPQFATHNAGTIAAILQMAARPAGVDASGGNGGVGGRAFGAGQGGAREAGGGHGAERAASHPGSDPDSTSFQGASPRFELQRLHGMSEGTYREVLKNPLVACRVYAPVGAHRDLLAYLVRRLLENGANSSFVHQLADASVALDELLVSPCTWRRTRRCRCRRTCSARAAGTAPGWIWRWRPCVRRCCRRWTRFRCLSWPSLTSKRHHPSVIWRKFAINNGARCRLPSALPPCAARPMRCSSNCPASARCWSGRPSRPGATRWPRCARRWTSCATTRPRPNASRRRWPCPAPPGRATNCTWAGAASGSASARGTFRWRSSWGRWRRRWPPATPCWPSRPSRRRVWRGGRASAVCRRRAG